MKKILFGLLVLGAFAGCLKGNDSSYNYTCTYNECATVAPVSEIDSVKRFLSNNGITATQHCSGMFYTIDSAGTGVKPTVCNNVAVTYKGTLTNGSAFDSTKGSPAVFGLSNVITGFKNGLPLIKTGGRIHLYIPPSLGYGARAAGPIPANSILIFDVTLVGVQ